MFRILPRDQEFFVLFEKAALNIQDGAELFKEMLDGFDDVREKSRLIEEIEHKGDTLTHELVKKLDTTFITPIDREDILKLASALDDIIDLIHGAATRIVLYKIDKPTPQAKELAFLILKSTRELLRAVSKMDTQLGEVYDHCVEVNSLENEADRVCRDAIAFLFEHETDSIAIIKWKEIYETMETATDRCEDAANVLESVALKNA